MAPPQSFDSYLQSVFLIYSFGSLAIFSWTILPTNLNVLCSVIFAVVSFAQVFLLVVKVAGYESVKNPWTGEWMKLEF